MPNNQRAQLSPNSVPRRLQRPELVTPVRGVGQDNPASPHARTATPQPASPQKDLRSRQLHTSFPRSQKRHTPKRKTVQLVLWVKPVVKAELERIAEGEGLSVSSTGAAFLENALQQNLHNQHTALLDTVIEKAIGKHMRSYSSRIAVLLVRSLFASEQTRAIVTNILHRQPGVTQPIIENILNGSSNTAKGNITRVTPQLKTIIQEVQKWIDEEVIASG